MINVLPFHDPLRLAEEGATLVFTELDGRLEFGIGRGVDEQEFLRQCMPYPEARPRFARRARPDSASLATTGV